MLPQGNVLPKSTSLESDVTRLMDKFCFVSDLHKFAARSNADAYEPELRRQAAESRWCVLGGDIFDFRWSQYGSPGATADAAMEWLAELTESCPETEIHFLLGNHDHNDAMTERLPALSEKYDRFHWYAFYARLGSTLFLHGDAADVPRRKPTERNECQATRLARRRERSRHHGKRPRSRASNRMYGAFLRTRLHRIVPKVAYPTRRVVKRLAHYLDGLNHGAAHGVRDVYFGHTHFPVRDYWYAGLTFHNGGAPIGKDPFAILSGKADADATVIGH